MLTACAQTTAPAETTETKTETTEPASETTETDATEAEIEAAAEEAEQEAEETDQLYIAAVAAEVGIPYFTTMQWGAMDAAKDYNVELYWTGPAEWDFSKQQTFIDGVMATNPDALMLVPTDNSALVTYVDTWMKEGTPVICTDLFLMSQLTLLDTPLTRTLAVQKQLKSSLSRTAKVASTSPLAPIPALTARTFVCRVLWKPCSPSTRAARSSIRCIRVTMPIRQRSLSLQR